MTDTVIGTLVDTAIWMALLVVAAALLLKLARRIRQTALYSRFVKERARAGLETLTDETIAVDPKKKPSKLMTYGCGHVGPVEYGFLIWGVTHLPTKEVLRDRTRCPYCVADATRPHIIRCALCGAPIVPGEGVALYGGPESVFKKEWTTMADDAYIGCLSMGCCPTAAALGGWWTTKGLRPLAEGASFCSSTADKIAELRTTYEKTRTESAKETGETDAIDGNAGASSN